MELDAIFVSVHSSECLAAGACSGGDICQARPGKSEMNKQKVRFLRQAGTLVGTLVAGGGRRLACLFGSHVQEEVEPDGFFFKLLTPLRTTEYRWDRTCVNCILVLFRGF